MSSTIKQVSTEQEFEEIINGNKLVVCDFFVTWCGPCKSLAPKLDTLAKEKPNVIFIKIDVDELEELSQKHEVSAMPTVMVFKHGVSVGRFIGADIEKLKIAIAKYSI